MNEKNLDFQFDDVRVGPCAFKVWKSGRELALEPKTFNVLLYLVKNRGRLVEKSELLEAVWKDTFVTENAMTREIAKLRKALGDDPKEARYIQTVHTRGYRFIAEVVEIDGARENGDERPAALTAHSQSDESEATAQPLLPPTDAARTAPPKNRRSFALKLSALLGALALITAGVWLIHARYQSFAVIGVQEIAQVTSWSGLDFYPAISPDGNTIAFSSDRTGSFEIYVKQLVTGAKEVQITSDGAENVQPAFSPDGSLIAYHAHKRGGIWVVPLTGGTPKQLTEFGGHPAWSPDGKWIAFANGGYVTDPGGRNAATPATLWIVSTEGGEPRRLTQPNNPKGGHSAPAWSPDGRRIVFDTNDPSFSEIWSVSTEGDDLKKFSGNLYFATDAVYAPDGKSVFFVAGVGSSLWQVNLSAAGESVGEPVKVFDVSNSRIRNLSVAAKAKRIVYSAMTLSSNLWTMPVTPSGDITGGETVHLTQSTNIRNTMPTFSPDGKRIAYAAYDGTNHLRIWTMNADGKNPTQLTSVDDQNFSPSWFPDGKQIAFRSERDGQNNVSSVTIEGAKVRKLFDLDHSTNVVRLSPDGKQFAFAATRDGVTNIWLRSSDGGEQQQLTFAKIWAGFPTWSPDGKWIVFEKEDNGEKIAAVVSSAGGEPVQLTFDKGHYLIWDWSPDSDKILFAGQRDSIWNIRWISRSTKQQKQLTNFTKLNSYVRYPAWSPSGNQIVYEYAETTGNIWVMDIK